MADNVGSDEQDDSEKNRHPTKNHSGLEMNSDNVSSSDTRLTDSQTSSSSRPASATSSQTLSPTHKGGNKKEREYDRDERIRLAKVRQAEERQKKLEELRHAQEQAAQHRRKLEEVRRQRIEDLKRRDEERRAAVDDRRRLREAQDQSKREAILKRTSDRLARYEEWKINGRKKGLTGSASSKNLSASTSMLCNKRHSMDSAGSTSSLSTPLTQSVSLRHIPNGYGSPGSSTTTAAASPGNGARPKQQQRRPRPVSMAGALPSSGVSVSKPQDPQTERSKSTDRIHQAGRTKSSPRPRSMNLSMDFESTDMSSSTSKLHLRKSTIERLSMPKHVRDKSESSPKDILSPDKKPVVMPAKSPLAISLRKSSPSTSQLTKSVPGRDLPILPGKQLVQPHKQQTPPMKAAASAKTSKSQENVTDITPTRSKSREKLSGKVDKHVVTKEKPATEPLPDVPKADEAIVAAPSTASEEVVGVKVDEVEHEETSAVSAPPAASEGEMLVNIQEPAQEPVQEDTGENVPEVKEPVKEESVEEAVIEEDVHEQKLKPAVIESVARRAMSKTGDIMTQSLTESRSASGLMSRSVTDGGRASDVMSRSMTDSMTRSAADISKDEYRVKLAEKRRQAREKAEHDADLERQRQEELRVVEEERLRQEEEEEQRQMEEAIRLAELGRHAEEERLRVAIEAEQQRLKEEAERLEQERIAKEAVGLQAKEDAERAEREKQERIKRQDEERRERKKRLEMIMARVKTDTATDSKGSDWISKSSQSSPSKSSASAESSSDEKMDDDSQGRKDEATSEQVLVVKDGHDAVLMSDTESNSQNGDSVTIMFDTDSRDSGDEPELMQRTMSPDNISGQDDNRRKFMSPFLQQLMEKRTDNESSNEEQPKFKSPLLQNLLGKKKVGSGDRVSLDKPTQNEEISNLDSDKERNMSNSLSGYNSEMSSMYDTVLMNEQNAALNMDDEHDVNNSDKDSEISACDIIEKHVASTPPLENDGYSSDHDDIIEHRTIVKQESREVSRIVTDKHYINSMLMENGSHSVDTMFMTSSNTEVSQSGTEGLNHNLDLLAFTIPPVKQNGLVDSLYSEFDPHDMADSSISMKTDEHGRSLTSSLRDDLMSLDGSTHEAPQLDRLSHDAADVDELIDLGITNKTREFQSTANNVQSSNITDDLLNFNTFGLDTQIPFVAFEDNNKHQQHNIPDVVS